MPRRRAQPAPSKAVAAHTLRLKPANPFELIRWLARSQSDPRKAVAELVQNSLDAGARHIELRRQRIRGRLCLVVKDDGEGVLPDLERREALEYLATHVGHSRKMGLDPATRTQQVIAGKYGVGLLGFWAIGKVLELRTRVAGSKLMALRLQEDSARAEILPLPLRIDEPPTFTEALVLDVHPAAEKALGGRRIAEYLAAELRGQLLGRDVALRVHDDVARGTAQKSFAVVPKRFAGERLDLPVEVPVEGHPAIKVELYLARGAERPAVQVACAGTLVAADVTDLEALGIPDDPWVGRDVVGLLDFAGFNVPPGTRRGVMPDAAATAFADALAALAPKVEAELARLDTERRAATDRDLVRDLKRALRGFSRRLPRYELPRVNAAQGESGDGGGGASGEALDGDALPDTSLPEEVSGGARGPAATELPLFPVGPLVSVRVAPSRVKLVPGTERKVVATARDADGRPVEGAVFVWTAIDPDGTGLTVGEGGARVPAKVADHASVGATAALRVEASHGGRRAIGEAEVLVVERDDEAALGIPEPELVNDADGAWRSRMQGARWQVNAEHEDYRAFRSDARARLRYLVSLLAKEIVLRSSGRPDVEDLLESLVEVLAHAERNLRGA